MKKLFSLFLISCITFSLHAATVYEVKAQKGDAVPAYKAVNPHPGDPTWRGVLDIYADSVMIPNGEFITLADTITFAGQLPNRPKVNDGSEYIIGERHDPSSAQFALVQWQGQKRAIEVNNLQFSKKKSDSDAKDYLYEWQDHRSLNLRFWGTLVPFTLIFILLIASVILIGLADLLNTNKSLAGTLLIASGAATLVASLIELQGFYTANDAVFWWLDISGVGLWKALIGLVFMLIAAAAQFGGMWYFSKVVTKHFGSEEKPITVMPLLKTMGIALAAIIVFTLINAFTFKWQWLNVLAGIAALAYILWYIWKSMGEWSEALGTKMGKIFTVYAGIWTFSSLIAVMFYAIGFLKVIIPILVTVAVGLFLFWLITHIKIIPIK